MWDFIYKLHTHTFTQQNNTHTEYTQAQYIHIHTHTSHMVIDTVYLTLSNMYLPSLTPSWLPADISRQYPGHQTSNTTSPVLNIVSTLISTTPDAIRKYNYHELKQPKLHTKKQTTTTTPTAEFKRWRVQHLAV